MPGRVVPHTYAIDNWHQAPGARSATDPTLRIQVTDFINSDILEGVRIQVKHPQYGVLFACTTGTKGRLVSYDKDAFLTTKQILTALRQFGFDIHFKLCPVLDEATKKFLEGCLATGYTHIRWAVRIWTPWRLEHYHWCDHPHAIKKTPGMKERVVICFNETKRPYLINQFIKPIVDFDGDIMEVSPDDNPKLNFEWLPSDMPYQISSLLTK